MPLYQFAAAAGSGTMRHRAELAAAVTRIHFEVTGAPAAYVQCTFVELPTDGLYASGNACGGARLLGVIRNGRSTRVKADLLHRIADAWSVLTGEPRHDLAVFLVEVPGANMLEAGQILPEADADRR